MRKLRGLRRRVLCGPPDGRTCRCRRDCCYWSSPASGLWSVVDGPRVPRLSRRSGRVKRGSRRSPAGRQLRSNGIAGAGLVAGNARDVSGLDRGRPGRIRHPGSTFLERLPARDAAWHSATRPSNSVPVWGSNAPAPGRRRFMKHQPTAMPRMQVFDTGQSVITDIHVGPSQVRTGIYTSMFPSSGTAASCMTYSSDCRRPF